MNKVNPFNGVRYNSTSFKNMVEVLAPPYDVISPDDQDALYNLNDKNVVRLILGKINDTDTQTDNRYTRASADLSSWLADGSLIREEAPAIYLYAQDYEIKGEKLRRVGFICRRLIEEFGGSVFRHERTISGPKIDRLNLTRACKMNFSPVFGLYSDPGLTLDKVWEGLMSAPADIEAEDNDGVIHYMWKITDESVISQVTSFMEDKSIVIADGHHRYETALNYRNEMREKTGQAQNRESECLLMYISNTHSQGFTVLPTHRVVADRDLVSETALLAKLNASFDTTQYDLAETSLETVMEQLREAGASSVCYGVYTGKGKMYIAKLKDDVYQKRGEQGLVGQLDVTVLQDLIFADIFDVTQQDMAAKKYVSYTVDEQVACDRVDSGEANYVFLMNKTDVNQVVEVATAGDVMPQKSTYFYPKLISGLVFNPLS